MDVFTRMRLNSLHAQMMCVRLEKASLARELTAPATATWRKEEVMIRYSALVSELRKIVNELEILRGMR